MVLGFLGSSEFRTNVIQTLYRDGSSGSLPFFRLLLKRPAAPGATEIQFWLNSGLNLLNLTQQFAASAEYFARK